MKYSKIILSIIYLVLPFFAVAMEENGYPSSPRSRHSISGSQEQPGGRYSISYLEGEPKRRLSVSHSRGYYLPGKPLPFFAFAMEGGQHSINYSEEQPGRRRSINYSEEQPEGRYSVSYSEGRYLPRDPLEGGIFLFGGWVDREEVNNGQQEGEIDVRKLMGNISVCGLRTKKEIKNKKYQSNLSKLKKEISRLIFLGNRENGNRYIGNMYVNKKISFYECHFDKNLIKNIGRILNIYKMLSMEVWFFKCSYSEGLEEYIQKELFFEKQQYIQCTKISEKKRRNWNCIG